MSDEAERICPLCAEEMDLTDQQLKPCKCGYEICVWCWHHIMDMAEKDQTDGRCPACRTPYNKAKIVGMTENCERLVAELNMERKMKSQKAKSKTSEGRKQLSSVRVIQRNLVYIVGLPLNLAEEDLLQHREYFGQYGKVLKVSISRTAAGAIQHFANNTCSVYITYSKEEEAVRCIQSVHGFVLDGKSLRACFGTTKYCHAWLRNVPCSNPECLYLHEVGSEEDSFIKDEIVSACTRSRVQQITGATNSIQRRSGNVLPPPADEYYIHSSASSGKPISKSSSNNSASCVRGSPPNSSSGRLVALPAAASWGMRAFNNQPPSMSLACSNGHLKQKPERGGGSMEFSKAVADTTQVPLLHGDVGKNFISNVEGQTILHKGQEEPLKTDGQYEGTDHQTIASGAPASQELPAASIVNSQLQSAPSSEDKDRCTNVEPNITNSLGFSGQSYGAGPDKVMNVSANGNIQNLCSEMASMNFDRHIGVEPSGHTRPSSSLSDNTSVTSPQNQGLQQCVPEKVGEPLTSIALGKALALTDDIHTKREQSDLRSDFLTRESGWRSDSQTQVPNTDLQVAPPEVEKDLQYFEDQRLKDPELVTSCFPNLSHSFHHSGHSGLHSSHQNEPFGSTSFNRPHVLDGKVNKGLLLHPSGVPIVPNGYPEDLISNSVDLDRAVEHSYLFPSEVKRNHSGRFEVEATSSNQNVATDMLGESNIISNILSIDFDAWDETLASSQNLAKFLGETDRRQGCSLKSSNSWKAQNSQSRFSFARYDEPKNEVSNVKTSLSNIGRVLKDDPSTHDFAENKFFNFDKFGDCNGFSAFNIEEPNNFTSSYSHLSPNKLSASRTHVSAPPGFSVPSRVPPPGFASHERMEPTFDAMSGHQMLDASALLRNPYQALLTGNIGSTGDIEFMDPAILAVGKGRLPGGLNNTANLDMRSNFSSQLSAYENEARLQLLMQRSLFPLQNQRFADMEDSCAPFDAYRVPPRTMGQTLASNLSPFSQISLQQPRTSVMSNGQWDGWNEVQSGNDLSMAELLRTERLGFNKFYGGGYEDSKFRMNNSGDLYNRTYGI